MRNLMTKIAGFLVLAAGVVVLPSLVVADGEIGTGKIMQKLHGKKGIHKEIAKLTKSGEADYTKLAPLAKEYDDLATALTKNEPEVGDKASWTKLTKSYATDATALHTAADKKDDAGFKSAFGKLSKSCKACHDNHR
ncbi:cytochrome c [Tuwongella immobilis]|uniref:Cytochrome c n=1 Tax=Tuwongella immobilis TaxID=692036 RepID=A0A6C2YNL5_9BACT|nr:cytochrome c [Tuwongella immobilis]VIP02881.1 cytochrome c : Cytochrome C OS=Singulisphaera acidiphila (strain ATCC BAA-1392 / DSM 18658 / VKM B-2454 / MOB10) GN=Sinac_3849 PE=4 SV=1: Cytochrom_C_2 [Tuwongella immobilis]VTS02731.1 cytochrome c : Cytochrome C OS=Singulisphaera acidiphila (strain ATCC BAA-1392 / DSM 18658 / VKM B-2454 / MOB10) GN=Sinac_3849 PE=4 SV=1: Cytochrom_C_2 [Tuwongella immobilis]